MNLKILFLFGKKDKYIIKLHNFFKKLPYKFVFVFSANTNSICKKFFNVKNYYYDYVVCYRSKYILKAKDLKKSKNPPLNFHPGPPEYRGVGCANKAILDRSKFYGVTLHVINEKIDNGPILYSKKFKIKANVTLPSLLEKTYNTLFKIAKQMIPKIFSKRIKIETLIRQNKEIKWSKSIYTSNDLEQFYKINKNISKVNFEKKLRATVIKNYKPYILCFGKKFYLE